jgi:hypothetical protein
MGEEFGKYGGVYIQSGYSKVRTEEREQLEELGKDGRIIVHWTLKKLGESLWNGLSWQSVRKNNRTTGDGNEKHVQENLWNFLFGSETEISEIPVS